ncbi:MAG TPA: hypothetical protein VFX92_05845 [Candidatus Krumholzibacteria bacterium]|nr:hypothetical protein [Candidatus Krumholzibacteria bacterium]
MKNTRAVLLATLLTALVYVAGQVLAAIPNVELVTFLAFVAGFLLGPLLGAVVGGAGMAAHSLFNVMGMVAPPVWIAQWGAYALVGVAGALAGPWIAGMRRRGLAAVVSGVTGAALVLFYQAVVNAVSFVTFASGISVWVYVWGGIAFAALQMIWNAALFAALLVPTLHVLARYRRELAVAR